MAKGVGHVVGNEVSIQVIGKTWARPRPINFRPDMVNEERSQFG